MMRTFLVHLLVLLAIPTGLLAEETPSGDVKVYLLTLNNGTEIKAIRYSRLDSLYRVVPVEGKAVTLNASDVKEIVPLEARPETLSPEALAHVESVRDTNAKIEKARHEAEIKRMEDRIAKIQAAIVSESERAAEQRRWAAAMTQSDGYNPVVRDNTTSRENTNGTSTNYQSSGYGDSGYGGGGGGSGTVSTVVIPRTAPPRSQETGPQTVQVWDTWITRGQKSNQ